ncbi:Holliday junction resolvase RuvX [Dichelobacter nodosus]|uniref:YqgF/RNase H-like domain-containing protein n=1 Tax=Dichelobacter nodosus (strain VCS1703A) TaxID=246195 RepID=A5EXP5_DICNV|nr:Holliday junction resolvase RuvX [Dichelobacter nodosus]ABQ14141.1 conserved hypothetical protein [Dichelobacter nodosus VCS1703A]AXM45875.1 Holliday junction resolvase RuvX [Dichelobacter nodosus]KNZ39041.1 hypothetical protein AKG33_04605 [Dichelobacter nodosus]TGA64672.1 Holliday junction resolvase RuvX [Dichelobacter nodosus]
MVQWVLGIDVGTYHTGVAIGQSVTGLAKPLQRFNLPLKQVHADTFSALVQQWKVNCIVIGLPSLADGKKHPLSDEIHRLADECIKLYGVPVHFIDETLTSHAAQMRFPKTIDKDSAAAAVIVEDFLSSH